MEIVGQVEFDPEIGKKKKTPWKKQFNQKILRARFPDVPKWGDIKNVKGKEIIKKCGRIDLISGGFPCQPFSVAGARKGKGDHRNLWPHMSRIIREIRPAWVLAENVPGLLSISDGRVFGEVVRDLAESGYCVEWDCIPASAVGAPHQRDRVWVIAYAESFGGEMRDLKQRDRELGENGVIRKAENLADPESRQSWEPTERKGRKNTGRGSNDCGGVEVTRSEDVANPTQKLRERSRFKKSDKGAQSSNGGQAVADSVGHSKRTSQRSGIQEGANEIPYHRDIFRDDARNSRASYGWFWKSEPAVGRVAHGIANRVDRLKMLGNGQLIQEVEWLGKRILAEWRLEHWRKYLIKRSPHESNKI